MFPQVETALSLLNRFRNYPLQFFKPSFMALLLILFGGIEKPSLADEPEINLDGTPLSPPRKAIVLALGMGYSIGSDLGLQPQLGGYLDLPKSWQAGLRMRLAMQNAENFYDYFPQFSLELRKFWLGDEGSDPNRNSEYFSLCLGGFLAYEFAGPKIGPRPLGALILGKNWMPIDNSPFGLDIYLELSRLFSGHLLNRSQLVFITPGISLFYVLP